MIHSGRLGGLGRLGWRARFLGIGIALSLLTVACAPMGSQAWCKKLKGTPKGDWSANEAKDFARHCVFR